LALRDEPIDAGPAHPFVKRCDPDTAPLPDEEPNLGQPVQRSLNGSDGAALGHSGEPCPADLEPAVLPLLAFPEHRLGNVTVQRGDAAIVAQLVDPFLQ